MRENEADREPTPAREVLKQHAEGHPDATIDALLDVVDGTYDRFPSPALVIEALDRTDGEVALHTQTNGPGAIERWLRVVDGEATSMSRPDGKGWWTDTTADSVYGELWLQDMVERSDNPRFSLRRADDAPFEWEN
jgi:hypothetical protein